MRAAPAPAALRVALVGACLAGCGGQSVGERPPSRDPTTASAAATVALPELVTADTATVEAPLSLPAQLWVEHDAIVFARSSGVVESLLVDLGRRVTAGQTLARLESVDQGIALAQARDRFANAEQRAKRERALRSAGVVTRADAEQVEYEYREAELGRKKAQREYDLTRIVAPFDGVITARSARIGRLVAAGDTLFRLTALAPLLASVRVPEASAFGLRLGDETGVVGPRGQRARARVVRASPIVDAASGTREVVLRVAPRSGLMPGASVTVRLGAERRRVVAVPRSAVGPEGYALVWDDHRTTLRAVTLGSALSGDRVEVVSGLTAGEQVVASGP